ncbi:type IV pilus biogenesis/stability protein PilW [Chitinivorax sp. PXF-14]|uniref:type IV pilus biogenesis/stability protein PilW n=1 Tax=Chitinivorax sp. PXF-14 TaxID=3230488 RepID=UPI003467AA4D
MTKKTGWLWAAMIGALLAAPPGAVADEVATRSASLHTELAAQYYLLRQFAVSIDEANQALQAVSSYAPALNMLGLVYSELKEYGTAEDYFRRALSAAPNDSDVNHNYGVFLCRRGRTGDGVKRFEAAVRNPLYGTPEKSLVAAAECRVQGGDLASARADFSDALQRRPDYPPALAGMARLSYDDKKYLEARAYFSRLFEVVDPYPEGLFLAAQVERQLGDAQGEARYLAQLKKLFPKSKEAAQAANGRAE